MPLFSHTVVPPHRFESVPPNESTEILETAELTLKLMRRRYPKSVGIRRGVHPKDHGCLRAVFHVHDNLDQDLRVGVFAEPGHKYDAWVRFSNAAAVIGPDVVPNLEESKRNGSRGMAIKLMGVEGPVLIEHQGADTQDFLMINSPAFAFANVFDYLALTKGLLAHQDDTIKAFGALQAAIAGTPAGLARLQRSGMLVAQIQARSISNPLRERYFSGAPFLFGDDRVMHYSARPTDESPWPMPPHPSDTYLRESLSKQISENPVEFEFLVQVRGANEPLEIEDATAEWKEADTPFRSVARITIPVQEPDTGGSRKICEELFFTPWHSLPAHQPLGGINRLRNDVYFASSMHRHHPKEPTGREWV